MGKIAYIGICHPSEATKYRELLLPVKCAKDNQARKIKRNPVRLKTKGKLKKKAKKMEVTIGFDWSAGEGPKNNKAARKLRIKPGGNHE